MTLLSQFIKSDLNFLWYSVWSQKNPIFPFFAKIKIYIMKSKQNTYYILWYLRNFLFKLFGWILSFKAKQNYFKENRALYCSHILYNVNVFFFLDYVFYTQHQMLSCFVTICNSLIEKNGIIPTHFSARKWIFRDQKSQEQVMIK